MAIVKISCIFGELVRLSWLIYWAQLHFFLKVSIPTDKKYIYIKALSEDLVHGYAETLIRSHGKDPSKARNHANMVTDLI